jgi:hypothetical protein
MLSEMLELRRENWSLTKLAEKYKVDHTSILYQCRKYEIVPGATHQIVVQTRKEIPLWKKDFDGETLCAGRTYKEYLAIIQRRSDPLAKLFLNAQRKV